MLEDASNSKTYNTDGVTTSFPITFDFHEDDTICAWIRNISTKLQDPLVNPDDFSIDGKNLITVDTWDTGYKLLMMRAEPQSQTLNLDEEGPMPSRLLELRVDKLTMLVQDLTGKLKRALLLPETYPGDSLIFPEPNDKHFLEWQSGVLQNTQHISGAATVWNRTGTVLSPKTAGDDVSLAFGDLVSEQNPDAIDAIRMKATVSDVDVVLGDATGYFTVWNLADNNAVFYVDNLGNTDIAGDLTIASLTAGSVLFAGAGGIISQDNTKLFWDDTNKRFGIGTESPQKDLHIESGVPTIRMSDSNAAIDQAVATLIEFYRANNTNRVGFLGMESSSNDDLRIATDYAAGQIKLGTGSNVTALTIDSSQNVDIGTVSPKTKLTVEGAVTLKEQAAAEADTAAYGQLWAKIATPNELWFTNDAGTDHQLGRVDAQIDHGGLAGKGDDDHAQYHNNTRGDARYLGIAAKAADSALLNGVAESVSAGNNTIVKRHAAGYIFANYFNTTPNDVSSGITKVCIETGNDGYIRHGTQAGVRIFIGAGSGNGLVADLLDALHASSFIRSDADDNVSAHTEWQDNKEVRLGTDADFRMYFDGASTHFRGYKHGASFQFQGEDIDGVLRSMLFGDPDGATNLYHAGFLKLATAIDGVTITGKVKGVTDPTDNQDAATKKYVDDADWRGIHIGNNTRTIVGDQIITGVGFTSSVIIFLAVDNNKVHLDFSVGFDDGTVHMCVCSSMGDTIKHLSNIYSISIQSGAVVRLKGAVSAIGGDGFTITWAAAGGQAVDFIYLCLP